MEAEPRPDPEWRVSDLPVDYADAVRAMEARVAAMRDTNANARELIWLLEHPPLLTAGTSARAADLLRPDALPVHASGRGGQYTWHGPGQRVVYAMLDLGRWRRDLRAYVAALEAWGIGALARVGVSAHAIPGRVGLWTRAGDGDAKIGAIGVRVRGWVTYHGLAVNVDPDLSGFAAIRACGLDAPVTSLAALGVPASLAQFDAALAATLPRLLRSCAGDAVPAPLEQAPRLG